MSIFATKILKPLNLTTNISVKASEHGTRIFQTAGTSEMLKDENFLFVCHFPGGSASERILQI
jgi:hypothetical protein